jgi:hypothetical protein
MSRFVCPGILGRIENSMKGLMILGMHRSGTSALAGQCAGLGLSFGDNLLPAQVDNPEGYYEDIELVSANDTLCTMLFGGWDSPLAWADAARLFPVEDSQVLDVAKPAKEVLRSLSAGEQHWAVKDPRLSRLLPIWSPMIQDSGLDVSLLMAVRRPTEVAASLGQRNRLGVTTSLLLWLRHVAEPLAYALEHGLTIGIVSFDKLVSSPRHLLEILKGIGFPVMPGRDRDFVDASLRHHRHKASPPDDEITRICERLYELTTSMPVFSQQTVSPADADTVRAARDMSLEPYFKDLYLEARGLVPDIDRRSSDEMSRSTLALTVADLRKKNRELRIERELLEKQVESRTIALKKYDAKILSTNSTDIQSHDPQPASAVASANIVVKEFSTLQQFARFRAEHPDLFSAEKVHGAAKRIAENGIYCNVFKEFVPAASVTIHDTNYRETITHKGINSRLRAVHHVLEMATAAMPPEDIKIFAPEGVTTYAKFLRGTNAKFIGAEYTTDPRVKNWLFPVPVEDIHHLTFPDMSFHAAVINELFEHVPHLDTALRELARILLPGGKLVSSFSFHASSHASLTRARIKDDGEIKHLMAAEYRSNPLDEQGSLVFEIPGWNILSRTCAAGFRTATMLWVYSESCGMLAPHHGGHFVLLAEK